MTKPLYSVLLRVRRKEDLGLKPAFSCEQSMLDFLLIKGCQQRMPESNATGLRHTSHLWRCCHELLRRDCLHFCAHCLACCGSAAATSLRTNLESRRHHALAKEMSTCATTSCQAFARQRKLTRLTVQILSCRPVFEKQAAKTGPLLRAR